MAFQNPGVFFDADVIDARPYKVFAKARDGNLGAIAQCTNSPNFVITGATVSDETLDVLNLSDQGVVFPADTLRYLKVNAYLRGNTSDDGLKGYDVLVEGGSTPQVVEAVITNDLDTELPSATAALSFHVTGDEVVIRATGTPSGTGGPANWEVEVYVKPLKHIAQAAT